MKSKRFSTGLLVLALIASACGSDRDPDDESAQETTTSSSGDAEPAGVFGTLESPCGEGDAAGSSDQGVTDESIQIGYGDDAGFAASPGLNAEVSAVVKEAIEWCNEQGGINGRPLEATYYDAKLFEITNAYTEACPKEFFLVGNFFAADDQGEATRRECGLPVVPTGAVSHKLANGPLYAAPSPNPVDYTAISEAVPLKELFPEQIKNSALIVANYPSSLANTYKVIPALETFGYEFDCEIQYNIAGEADWKPFAQQLKDCGAEFVYFVGIASPTFQALLEAANQLDYDPIWLTDQNNYDSTFAEWNTNGFADKVYMRLTRGFVEEADQNPALQTYLEFVETAGTKASPLGQSGLSAFLLWATAAKACGSDLTRDCVMSELHDIHEWDAGGLQAVEDPGANLPGECGMVIKLTGTAFERVFPTEEGTYHCDPANRFKVEESPDLEAAKLDENRIAQL